MASEKQLQRLLYKIARAYYQDELTQQEIAARFRLSRPKVSRLLQKAKDQGIVQITLIPPAGETGDEARLEELYGLEEAIIVNVSDCTNAKTISYELGPAAAEVLLRSLQGEEIVGMAWGASILSLVEALPSENYNRLTVAPLVGGLGLNRSNEHSEELVRRTAQKLNAHYRLLPAPGIAATTQAANVLKKDPQIAETLAFAQKAHIAVVGLGTLSPDSFLLQRSELLSPGDQRLLLESGAVGDVILRFLDLDGNPMQLEINKRIIGVTFEQLKKIPRVIGIAGGRQKLKIIQAVLQSGILDVLITDHGTASALIKTKPDTGEKQS